MSHPSLGTASTSSSGGSSLSDRLSNLWNSTTVSKRRLLSSVAIALLGLGVFRLASSLREQQDVIPLPTVAHITAEHTTFARDLFEDLKSVTLACNGDNLHHDELSFLSNAVRPFSSRTANSLAVASDHARRLRRSLHWSDYYVGDRLYAIPKVASALVNIIQLLQKPALPSHIVEDARIRLAQRVNYWSMSVLIVLHDMETELKKMHEHCEIISHQFSQAIPALPALEADLGLTPPPSWLWWRRRSWNRDGTVKERKRWLATLSDSNATISRLSSAVERSQEDLVRYLDADIWQTLRLYPPLHAITSNNISLPEYLYISTSVEAMQILVREAQNRPPNI